MHELAPESSERLLGVYQFIFKTNHGNPHPLPDEIQGSDVFIMTIRGLGQYFYGFLQVKISGSTVFDDASR